MEKEQYILIEMKLRDLVGTLHKECVDSGLITVEQWNEEIASKLSNLSMAIEGVTITARNYKLSK